MEKFIFNTTQIKDLYLIETCRFEDNRGYFMETFNQAAFKQLGIRVNFVQDNESKSSKGVMRGLHFQSKQAQGKLVRVTKGMIFDVAVDLRVGSPTFKKSQGFVLSDENRRQLYIPEGFAHGFLVLSEEAIFQYKCTDFYAPQYEGGVVWNDPDLGIDWPVEEIEGLIISDKDQQWPTLEAFESPFVYEEEIIDNDMKLSPIEKKDIEMIRLWRNIESYQKTFIHTSLISHEAQLSWYESYKKDIHDRMFMIKMNNRPVGVISLYNIDYKKGEAEFGRLLIGDLSYRGQNIGFKATRALCEYGFSKLGLQTIKLEVFKDNVHAIKVYEKTGFKISGERSIDNKTLLLMTLVKRGGIKE